MKKLILTLGLLMCGGAAYGMKLPETEAEWETYNLADMQQAMYELDWCGVALILTRQNSTQAGELFYGMDAAILNLYSTQHGSLIGALIHFSKDTDIANDRCAEALVKLIRVKKLNLEAKDAEDNLLYHDKYINNAERERFRQILQGNGLQSPVIEKNTRPGADSADVDNCTYRIVYGKVQDLSGPKPKILLPYKWFLSATVVAGLVLAAVGIYKWFAAKKKTVDNANEDDATDEKLEETHEQVTV